MRAGILCIAVVLSFGAAAIGAPPSWPQFRGPGGLGIATGSYAPTYFSPASNVLWKTELPSGNSSPSIWKDRLFLTTFDTKKLETICLDRLTGNILWRRIAPAQTFEPTHRMGSPATATAACDSDSVYVYFGSFGLLAYDHSGTERWRKPLPTPVVEFGASASPILADGRLIQVCDQDEGSYVLAVDPRDGKTLWKTDRPEFRRSFATPLVWEHDGSAELVVPGSIWLRSYNLADGSERWSYSGTSRVACSSPTAGDGLLFSASWNVGGDSEDRITMAPATEFFAEHDHDKDGKLTSDEIPPGPIRDRKSVV